MKKLTLFLICSFFLICLINAQDTLNSFSSRQGAFKRGYGIFPFPNKTMLSYRSNLVKKWAFDAKFGYTFTAVPQLNIELNMIRRNIQNGIFNFYTGLGATVDGITPGIVFPVGYEIAPFTKYPNILIVAEASPKICFSFSSAFYSTLSGNFGIIYFRPKKSK